MKKIILGLIFIIFTTSAFAAKHYPLGSDGWYYDGNYSIVDTHYNNKSTIRLVRNNNNGSYHIEFDGEFTLDKVTHVIENYIYRSEKYNNHSTKIYLSSNGGNLYEGFSLGLIIRDNQMETIVMGNQICASACAIAFIGGKFRSIKNNGKVGTHTPYELINKKIVCDNKYSNSGEILVKYIKEMLGETFGNKFVRYTYNNCSNTMIWSYSGSYITN